MPNYLVSTPEYESQSYDYYEPPEYGRDICLVIGAKDSNDAKWWAIRNWRKLGYEYIRDSNHPCSDLEVMKIRVYKKDLPDYGDDIVIVKGK